MTKKIFLAMIFAALVVMTFGVITSGAWFTDTAQVNDLQI